SALLAPSLAEATRVEIVEHDRTLAVEAHNGQFDEAAAGLLRALESLRVLAVIASHPEDPGMYGCGAAAVRLRVLADERTRVAVELGDANPAGTGVYVRREGDPAVLLVGALLRWELEKVVRARSAP